MKWGGDLYDCLWFRILLFWFDLEFYWIEILYWKYFLEKIPTRLTELFWQPEALLSLGDFRRWEGTNKQYFRVYNVSVMRLLLCLCNSCVMSAIWEKIPNLTFDASTLVQHVTCVSKPAIKELTTTLIKGSDPPRRAATPRRVARLN